MARSYKNQGIIEKMSVKTGIVSYRLSSQRKILYGGRGTRFNELTYLRNQNTDAVGVNKKLSDGWIKFALANSAPSGKRYDTIYHDFTKVGVFP